MAKSLLLFLGVLMFSEFVLGSVCNHIDGATQCCCSGSMDYFNGCVCSDGSQCCIGSNCCSSSTPLPSPSRSPSVISAGGCERSFSDFELVPETCYDIGSCLVDLNNLFFIDIDLTVTGTDAGGSVSYYLLGKEWTSSGCPSSSDCFSASLLCDADSSGTLDHTYEIGYVAVGQYLQLWVLNPTLINYMYLSGTVRYQVPASPSPSPSRSRSPSSSPSGPKPSVSPPSTAGTDNSDGLQTWEKSLIVGAAVGFVVCFVLAVVLATLLARKRVFGAASSSVTSGKSYGTLN